MVSKAREDLPDPLRPVMTTSLSRGISTSRFLRLCSRAPRMMIEPAIDGGIITRGFRGSGRVPCVLGEDVSSRLPGSNSSHQARLDQGVQQVHGALLGNADPLADLLWR